jgi:hypothetical protein
MGPGGLGSSLRFNSSVSMHFAQDLVHFGGVVGAIGLGSDVALRAEAEEGGGGGFFVEGVEDDHAVEGTMHPVARGHIDAEVLGRGLEGGGALARFMDVREALFGEVQQTDEDRHRCVSVGDGGGRRSS